MGLGDNRSIANCISGSREAIDIGQGLSGRETVKHITRWTVFGMRYSCYERVFHPSGNHRNNVNYTSVVKISRRSLKTVRTVNDLVRKQIVNFTLAPTVFEDSYLKWNMENACSLWSRKNFVFGSPRLIHDHPQSSTASSCLSGWWCQSMWPSLTSSLVPRPHSLSLPEKWGRVAHRHWRLHVFIPLHSAILRKALPPLCCSFNSCSFKLHKTAQNQF